MRPPSPLALLLAVACGGLPDDTGPVDTVDTDPSATDLPDDTDPALGDTDAVDDTDSDADPRDTARGADTDTGGLAWDTHTGGVPDTSPPPDTDVALDTDAPSDTDTDTDTDTACEAVLRLVTGGELHFPCPPVGVVASAHDGRLTRLGVTLDAQGAQRGTCRLVVDVAGTCDGSKSYPISGSFSPLTHVTLSRLACPGLAPDLSTLELTGGSLRLGSWYEDLPSGAPSPLRARLVLDARSRDGDVLAGTVDLVATVTPTDAAWTCTQRLCGDGDVDAGEACDDGNRADDDGCSTDCTVERCGDGRREAFEECDDGNLAAGDGCAPDCRREACGDGVLDPGEACDEPNDVADDACSITCEAPACGNRIVEAGEDCDDGDTDPSDGCDSCVRDVDCAGDTADTGVDPALPGCASADPTAFGWAVDLPDAWTTALAVEAAGGIVVRGAPDGTIAGVRSGRVDVFRRRGRALSYEATLSPASPRDYGHFGSTVRTDGRTIVVAADGQLQLFRWTGARWARDGALPSGPDLWWEDWDVDGHRLVASRRSSTDPGSLVLFERTGRATWTIRAEWHATTLVSYPLDLDGDTVAVRADGQLKLFRAEPGGPLTPLQAVSDRMTWVALDGPWLALGQSGSVAMWRRSGDRWTKVDTVDPVELVDADLALRDGLLVVPTLFGSPYQHELRVYRPIGGRWTQIARHADPSPWLGSGVCPTGYDIPEELALDDGYVVMGADQLLVVDLLRGSCGDGQVDPNTEACDDGGTVPGDGCSADCRPECGNGRIDGIEACDDGGTVGGDGCSATCQVEACGDRVVDAGEDCDDGDRDDGDGCDAACAWEPWQAAPGGVSVDVHGDLAMVGGAPTRWYRRTGTTWALEATTPVDGAGVFDGPLAVVTTAQGLVPLSRATGTWVAGTPWNPSARALAIEGDLVLAMDSRLLLLRHHGASLTTLATVPENDCSWVAAALDGDLVATSCSWYGLAGRTEVFRWDGAAATPVEAWPHAQKGYDGRPAVALRDGLVAWTELGLDDCEDAWIVRAVRVGDGPAVDLGSFPVVAAPVATDGVRVFVETTPGSVQALVPEEGWRVASTAGPRGDAPDWWTTHAGPWDPTAQALVVRDGWLLRGTTTWETAGEVLFTPVEP